MRRLANPGLPATAAAMAAALGAVFAAAAVAQPVAPVPLSNPLSERADLLADGSVAGSVLDFIAQPRDTVEDLLETLTSTDTLFASAYRRLEAGDLEGAARIARAMPGPAAGQLIEWLIAVRGLAGSDHERIAAAMSEVADWPGQTLMQLRYEQALLRGEPDGPTVIAAMADREPVLEATKLALARAHLAAGRTAEAAEIIRPMWRDDTFSETTEETILSEFTAVLTADDHRWRMSRLFYDGQSTAALRTAALLSEDTQLLADAWDAAIRGRGDAAARLAEVPDSLRSDPGYLYARLRMLMRSGDLDGAADLLVSAPTDPLALVDADTWSTQRRSLARMLVDRGDAATAYEVLAGHSAQERLETVEIAFQAGWVALRLLDDPQEAIPHFVQLAVASSLPLSQSRAAYWLGRSHEVLGNDVEADEAYRRAAGYPTTFYGQLATLRLGEATLALSPEPAIDAAAEAAFSADPMVQATIWLMDAGETAEAELIGRFLADTLQDPAQIAQLARLAETEGEHQLALQIGKLAANRGLAVDTVAFPTAAIPQDARTDYVEWPLVFAVARQETAFDADAVSVAGARGILQILPDTAREVAGSIGVAFSESRLSDPVYGATLGAAYLGGLIDRYGGNLVLALAAYNAGFTRADQWIEAYGDPRDPEVDAIDWIERIPFDETRDYVQRVLENLQVYRALMGDPTLRLGQDLGGAS